MSSLAAHLLPLLDYTRLVENDDPALVAEFCRAANTPFGAPAAICVYPEFIAIARQTLSEESLENVKIATVVNFPAGGTDLIATLAETTNALNAGAHEIDLVFPYRALMAGDEKTGFEMVRQCKTLCEQHNALLKVIIESGELKEEVLIKRATDIAINAGADFIKTSTGKTPNNATLDAARAILEVIKELRVEMWVGIKISGGIKTVRDAEGYYQLAQSFFGQYWTDDEHFRIGASSLLGDVLAQLNADA